MPSILKKAVAIFKEEDESTEETKEEDRLPELQQKPPK
jgi:hypothetical protein